MRRQLILRHFQGLAIVPNQVPLPKANCLWLRALERSVANIAIAVSNRLGNEAFHSNTFLSGHLIFILVVSKKKKKFKDKKHWQEIKEHDRPLTSLATTSCR